MPNGKGGWQTTNPPFHEELMSDADSRLNGDLKPLVRRMKLWNLREHSRLRSFHLEMMVERAWRNERKVPAIPLAHGQDSRFRFSTSSPQLLGSLVGGRSDR
jgi:hypothetical protein